ncbi:Putative Mce family protein [Mycobacteroides abscessus subsp. abscessus]|nr:Putative Mce family protein [Mycobacteroides abscessus subsp. abscessus]
MGKVEKIHLDGKNARITFNVLTDHPLYQNTTVAIRYQSLVGQRYVEIAQAPTPSAPLAAGTTIPLGQTIPSFDIAKLFNGFRPIFETLDPAQFNRLTENILQLIQGDERGIGPILRDIDAVLKLSVDRQAALQTIITNLGDISKDLGGTSDQLFYLINDLNDVLEPFEKQADEFNRAGADALPVLRRSVSLLRYIENSVDIAQAPTPSAPLAAGTTIPLGQTIPSFDIAKLFNGFRPIFETLDPAQFNRLTENILQLIQGDERGIGPILRDIDAVLKLSVDRQAALQTIITNLGDISKDLGGTSDQLFYLINDLNDVLEPFEKQADEFNRAGADALPVLRRSVSLLRYIENSVDGAQLPLYDVASRTTPGTPTIMAGLSLIPDLVQGMRDALIEEKTAPPTAYECKNGVVKMPGIGEVSFANQDLVVCK